MECVLAMGVLAVALPAIMLVWSGTRRSAEDSLMEGEARRVMLQHAHALMVDGVAEDIDRLVWAHDVAGDCLGVVDENAFNSGLVTHQGHAVRYLVVAEMHANPINEMRSMILSLQYPAAAALSHRKRIQFHTRVMP